MREPPSAIHLLLSAIGLATALTACSANQYDQQREWRLRQCEKLLYEKDQRDCKRNTPEYL